jgi:hypothetical protein
MYLTNLISHDKHFQDEQDYSLQQPESDSICIPVPQRVASKTTLDLSNVTNQREVQDNEANDRDSVFDLRTSCNLLSPVHYRSTSHGSKDTMVHELSKQRVAIPDAFSLSTSAAATPSTPRDSPASERRRSLLDHTAALQQL